MLSNTSSECGSSYVNALKELMLLSCKFFHVACKPVGVADVNKIPDDKITSSTVYLQYFSYQGRLHGATGWCPSTKTDRNDFIQVDMGAVRAVCAVATQGKPNGSFVTSFKLLLSTDGANWNAYKEDNVDKV